MLLIINFVGMADFSLSYACYGTLVKGTVRVSIDARLVMLSCTVEISRRTMHGRINMRHCGT